MYHRQPLPHMTMSELINVPLSATMVFKPKINKLFHVFTTNRWLILPPYKVLFYVSMYGSNHVTKF